MGFGIKDLLRHLHLLQQELDEEERQMAETAEEFDRRIAEMRQAAERKKRRVRFIELQVKAIQSRPRRRE